MFKPQRKLTLSDVTLTAQLKKKKSGLKMSNYTTTVMIVALNQLVSIIFSIFCVLISRKVM